MIGLRFSGITAEQIRSATAHARWGDADPVQLVCQGALAYVAGMRSSGTVEGALVDLGLLSRRTRKLTKRGRDFIYDICTGRDFTSAFREDAALDRRAGGG